MTQWNDQYEFLMEHGFHEWIKQPTPERDAYWHSWLATHPDYQEAADQLHQLIRTMRFDPANFTTETEDTLWQNIQLQAEEDARTTDRPQTRLIAFRPNRYQWIAASVVGVLVLTGILFFWSRPHEYTTAFGETQVIELPDGSTVTLNANSSLAYAGEWRVGKDREVTLKGEAFFEVNKQGQTNNRDRFVVHTEVLDVEVLGTEFNVNSRRAQTKVVLQSGKVKLSNRSIPVAPLYMTPGQMVSYNKAAGTFETQKVNTNVYAAWKDKKLLFDNTSLGEVGHILEDTYGVKVVLANPQLAVRKISGEINVSEKKNLLKALAMLYNLEITEQADQTLVIRTKATSD